MSGCVTWSDHQGFYVGKVLADNGKCLLIKVMDKTYVKERNQVLPCLNLFQ